MDNSNGFLQEGNDDADKVSIKWLTVTRGALVEKVDEGKGTSRINKLGNEVFEKFYERIGFKIEHMWIEDGKYGKQIIISTHVGDNKVNITMNNDSSYARSFYSQIFNVELDKMIIFSPYSFQGDNGKTITGVSIKQDQEKVEKQFPEGTPDVSFKEKGGKFIVNNIEADERLEFLEKEINRLIEDNNLTPPESWFTSNDNDNNKPLSDDEKAELKEAQKKGKKVNVESLDVDDDFDFEI